jgi:16S rRNA (guanine527-N7)-methyltransferase
MDSLGGERDFDGRIERVLAELGRADAADGARIEALSRLCALVVTWSAKLDLTAARSADELVDLIVADAALVSRHHLERGGERWVDVGSGGGAPGLPLSILLPGARLTLVEPKQKRVAFLRSAIGTLGLDAKVVRGRSDELSADAWDVAISRATLPPADWLSEGTRLARAACWVLLARAEPPELVGYRPDVDARYTWPLTGVERRAVRYVRELSP